MVALSTNARLTAAAVTPSPSSTVRATSLSRARSIGTDSCGLAILTFSMKKTNHRDTEVTEEEHREEILIILLCVLPLCLCGSFSLGYDAFGCFEAQHFAGQVLIVGRARALGGVRKHRLAETRALRQLDVPADPRLQDPRPGPRHRLPATLLEERFEITHDLLRQPRGRLVEADHYARHLEYGVDPLGDQCGCLKELAESVQRQ